MRIQKAPSNSCLPCAFAIACDVPVEDFINRTGHHGEEVAWPHYNDNKKYRGWHLQECQEVAYEYGFVSMPLFLETSLGHTPEEAIYVKNNARDFLNHSRTVLIDEVHAVACDGKTVFDPKGKTYPLGDSIYQIIIPIFPIKSN